MNNTVRINNKEAVVFGTDKAYVGVKSGNKIQYVDELTGLNAERDEVVSKEIYDRQGLIRRNWIVVDLETGTRGWYPGKEDSE